MIGTLEEAQAIFDAVGDRWAPDFDERNCPEGWKYLGCGGTRNVYLSPSGVVYKVCHHYYKDEPSVNDVEHANFEVIRTTRKLPRKWRVPKSHLHAFQAQYRKYNYALKETKEIHGRVAILACEYVDGETVGWNGTPQRKRAMDYAFKKIGLFDNARGNAMFGNDGYRYIVDAGEAPLTKEAA